jgi:hypothetical protein
MDTLLQAFAALGAVDTARLAGPDMIRRSILQVALLAGSAFFAMSETARFALSRVHLQKL